MRGNDLLFKMDLVDPSYIEAADRKPINWVRWSSVAACLCIAVIGLVLFLQAPKNGLVVKAVDNIDELSSVYDGTLLAENLLSSGAKATDIRLSYAAGGDVTDASTWDSLSVTADYNGDAVSLDCFFNGQTEEFDPSEVFDTAHYGDITVTICREKSEWNDEYWVYHAFFAYNGAAYNLMIHSNDEESIYSYLDMILGRSRYDGMEIENVMGFDICRIEVEQLFLSHMLWHYYAEIDGEERCIGEYFGFGGPEAWSADVDGDGLTELVCNCTWGGDGAQRVYVFRNNNGVIERGELDEVTFYRDELGFAIMSPPGSLVERYDPERNVFVVEEHFGTGDEPRRETFTGLEHFNFSEFICNMDG